MNREKINSNSILSRHPSILKSVVIVVSRLYSLNPFSFFDVREGSNLTTFWCKLLELHHSNHLNKLTSVAWDIRDRDFRIRDQLLPIQLLLPGLQLGHLESYWEPEPVLMRTVLDSPTKLKLISCYFDSNNFQNFCEYHPLLEVLKLRYWSEGWKKDIQNPSALNQDSWRNLSRLRILSLDSALFGIVNGDHYNSVYNC